MVGDADGDTVGSEVVGDTDGDTVGSVVVGDTDGDIVGSEVVGDTDGEVVGSEAVGDTDGDTVGSKVVGEAVGSEVAHSTNLAAGITASKLTSHSPPSAGVADGAVTYRCKSARNDAPPPAFHCRLCWISAAALEIEPQTPHVASLPQSGPELWSTTVAVALVLQITDTPADGISIVMAVDRLFW